MYPAFLSNIQIEELETFGVIEMTEELFDAMMNWCQGDGPIVENLD
jgi:hypothetical protein